MSHSRLKRCVYAAISKLTQVELEVLAFLHILRQLHVGLSRLHGSWHGKRGWLDSLGQIFRSTDTLACPHNPPRATCLQCQAYRIPKPKTFVASLPLKRSIKL